MPNDEPPNIDGLMPPPPPAPPPLLLLPMHGTPRTGSGSSGGVTWNENRLLFYIIRCRTESNGGAAAGIAATHYLQANAAV